MNHPDINHARRILRIDQVAAMVSMGKSTIYRMMAEGRFPKSRPLGPRATGWDSLEVEKWIAERFQ